LNDAGGTPRALSVSFRFRFRRCRRSYNDVPARLKATQAAPRRFRYGELDRCPVPLTVKDAEGAEELRPDPESGARRHSSWPNRRDHGSLRRPRPWPTKSCACWMERPFGQGDRRGPRRTAGGHRILFSVPREPPGVRGRARTPRCADLRLQGARFFEADEIQDAVAVRATWPSPTSNLRAAGFSGRASSGSSDESDHAACSPPRRWRSSTKVPRSGKR